MKLASIAARPLAIPFRVEFVHASAARRSTQTLWVEAKEAGGGSGYGEGCPREYVTDETVESALAFVEAHRETWLREIADVSSLREWTARHGAVIDANPAAWCAVELALLDLMGRTEGRPVEALLGVPGPRGRSRYTAVLGDAAPAAFAAQLAHYLRAGFTRFKIKLSGDAARDLSKVRVLAEAGVAPDAVRADANNLWPDAQAAIRALAALDFPFFAVEEPLRAGDTAGMARIAEALRTRIILDESVSRTEQLDPFKARPESWIVNVRVSKMGGLLRCLDLVQALRGYGLRIIVGAHVGETSVLTRAALTVAAAAGELLVAQEGAFGTHLLARDVADPPLMFGPGGILKADDLPSGAGGFGLAVTAPAE